MDAGKTGAYLAALRKARGMTQQEAADQLGVSNKTVSKWENGAGLPDITVLPALAELSGVTADDILAGETLRGRPAEAQGPARRRLLLLRLRTRFDLCFIGSLALGVLAAFRVAYVSLAAWPLSVGLLWIGYVLAVHPARYGDISLDAKIWENLYRKLLADAREMVQMRQEAVSSALTQDVRQASLQLAHFLLSEDSEGLALVDELPASSSRRYETAARLESIFDYYRLTGRRLEALHLYLTDGTSYQLYTGLAVPQNRVKEAAWYRAARQRPGEVCVGVAEPGTLLSGKNRRGDLLLTAALQVEPGYGGSALEVACLYFETDAEEMLESYNSEAGAVRMALALDGAFLAGDEALAPAVERFLGPEGVPGGGMDWGIATQVRNTGLTVVSLVDNRKLMAGYERTLWLCAGAVAAMLGSYALFSVLFLRRIVLPVQHLNEGMERLQQGDFTHKLPPEGHLEMRQLLQRYNDTGDRMQALIEENRLREEQRYAEELKALQSEINPHFLLNTVNTIRFMADLARFDSIRDMAADLMEILRCMLRTPAERYTLADEAKILEAYIHIMEVRYSGSFSFRCAFSPESLACRLPKLLLQPLVENALLHGLEGCEDGEVSLSGRTEDGVLYLSVCDNGVGMDPERLAACLSGPGEGKAGSSIGLANVQRRILLQYGAPYGLWVDSAPGRGTCISITLPAGSGREGGLPCCAQ